MKSYPALDVKNADDDLVLAVADDYSPTAAEQHDGSVTIFFLDAAQRERARNAVVRAFPAAVVTSRDVDDEDWARRSQETLGPMTVGRITVAPPWYRHHDDASRLSSSRPAWPQALAQLSLIIQPSMAFGTGHHATTRLCLAALQTMDLAGAFVLDVGTGSGVLAIAARKLGARQVLGIDHDPDAIQSARDNLLLNQADEVYFEVADLEQLRESVAFAPLALPPSRNAPASAGSFGGFDEALAKSNRRDVVMANLTGALLCRAAPALRGSVPPGGTLIVSGLLATERDEVVSAFAELDLVWEAHEDEWVGLGLRRA